MRPKIQKSIKTDLGKNGNLFIAEVINFPKDNSNDIPQNSKINNNNFWKLYDKANVNEDGDQLKAVIGICLVFGALFITGLYSNLI